MEPIGLYVHVPFCKKKCPYCDFYSIAPTEELMDKYTDAVCKNIKMWSQKIGRPANTLYFGGGTPSLLGDDRLSKIVETSKENFILDDAEITLEANPTNSYTLNFAGFLDSGINRLSIGVQSFNDNELIFLGRDNTAENAINTIYSAKQAGFNNISIDLMLAIVKQTEKSLKNSLEFCKLIDVQHVSAYLLKIEKGTVYYENYNALDVPDEDEERNLYLSVCKQLENIGFHQYEISNFAKDGYEGKHNLKYWNAEEYLGIGPSAHSFIGNSRFYYPRSLEQFMNGCDTTYESVGGDEEEYISLRLRLSKGLTRKDFYNRFNRKLPEKYFKNASQFCGYGLVNVTDDSISFTKEGFLVSNFLISRIV